MKFLRGSLLVFSTREHERSWGVPYHPARYLARAASFPASCIVLTSSGVKCELLMDLTRN